MTDTNTYSTRQAAEVLDLSQSTVQRMADEGTIPSYRTPGGFRRLDAGAVAGTRLHLDEHYGSLDGSPDGSLDARDDVDFAVPGAIPALKNCVPAASQFIACQVFAQFSQRLTAILSHDR